MLAARESGKAVISSSQSRFKFQDFDIATKNVNIVNIFIVHILKYSSLNTLIASQVLKLLRFIDEMSWLWAKGSCGATCCCVNDVNQESGAGGSGS